MEFLRTGLKEKNGQIWKINKSESLKSSIYLKKIIKYFVSSVAG